MKRKRTGFNTKKIKPNHNGGIWKTISIKKRIRTSKNNNKKNNNHIWYKNKISKDEIQRKINSIKDLRQKKHHN